MKGKLIAYGFVVSIIATFVFSSCLGDSSSDVEYSDKAWFVSLTFAENDSVPNLEDASFSLQYDATLGDSIIVNKDSLPFETRIDSVLPSFSFASTYAAYLVYKNLAGEDSSVVQLTGTDTVDFTKPMYVRNISADQSSTREYFIKVNVHQVEPELYVWNRMTNGVDSHNASNQHALFFQSNIFYFMSSSLSNYLYTAPLNNYSAWTARNITGLPVSVDMRTIKVFGDALYAFSRDDNKVYSSSNGMNWTGVSFPATGYDAVCLLMTYDDKLFGIAQQGDTYYLTISTNGTDWVINSALDDKFPIDQFASVVFQSRTRKEKALVYGGYTKSGQLLSNVWSTEDGYKWIDFSTAHTYKPIAGASIVPYDNKLIMFYGTDTLYIRHSKDEGFTWYRPDSAMMNIPEDFTLRTFQSTLVDDDNRILIFGGRNGDQILSDVWTTKVNRLGFINQ